MSDAQRGRLPALDGLRALAVFGVFAAHLGVPHLHGGVIGVLVFFVLSGFLITTLLVQEEDHSGQVAFGAFYIRRGLRLLPALALLLAVLAVYLIVFSPEPEQLRTRTLRGILPAAFYYANWQEFRGISLGALTHTWSLSVEEQFYIVWPLTLVWLRRKCTPRTILVVLGAASLGSLVIRALTTSGRHVETAGFGTHDIADQLLIGCMLALVLHRATAATKQRIASVAAAALAPAAMLLVGVVLFANAHNPSRPIRVFYWTVGLTSVALSTAALLAYLVLRPDAPATRLLGVGPLAYLGRISYGIYLWHLPIYRFFDAEVTGLRRVVTWAVVVALTVGTAALSYWLFERPALRLKERFTRSRGVVAAEPVP